MVASGKTLNFGTAGGELLRPRRASELLRRRSGVRRSGVSPQRAQGGKRGRCRQTGQTARSTSWVAVAPHVVLVVRAQPRLHRRDKRGAAAANRLTSGTVALTFLTTAGAIGEAGTFSLYATLGLAATAFYGCCVQEMTGRALEEAEA